MKMHFCRYYICIPDLSAAPCVHNFTFGCIILYFDRVCSGVSYSRSYCTFWRRIYKSLKLHFCGYCTCIPISCAHTAYTVLPSGISYCILWVSRFGVSISEWKRRYPLKSFCFFLNSVPMHRGTGGPARRYFASFFRSLGVKFKLKRRLAVRQPAHNRRTQNTSVISNTNLRRFYVGF
jgi:hypothetical protein